MKECASVGNEVSEELEGVAHGPGVGVVYLEMEVGPCGVACIAANGDEVAGADGELVGGKEERQRVLGSGALQLGLVGVGKALQMAVDAGVAVGMADVDGVAEAVHVDGEPADVAVGDGEDVLALLVAGLDVDAAVEVPGSRLAEVARQHDVVVDGRDIVNIRIADRLGFTRTTACQQ